MWQSAWLRTRPSRLWLETTCTQKIGYLQIWPRSSIMVCQCKSLGMKFILLPVQTPRWYCHGSRLRFTLSWIFPASPMIKSSFWHLIVSQRSSTAWQQTGPTLISLSTTPGLILSHPPLDSLRCVPNDCCTVNISSTRAAVCCTPTLTFKVLLAFDTRQTVAAVLKIKCSVANAVLT